MLEDINLFFEDRDIPLQVKELPIVLEHESIDQLIYSDRMLVGDEYNQVVNAFLPDKKEAICLLEQAGMKPSVSGGGAMQTINTVNGCKYPRLNQSTTEHHEIVVKHLQNFHCNMTVDKLACDELIYMLSGGVHFYFYTPRGIVHLDVIAARPLGWLLIYKGSIPHGGLFSPVAKQLAVLFGPKQWTMQFYTLAQLESTNNHWK